MVTLHLQMNPPWASSAWTGRVLSAGAPRGPVSSALWRRWPSVLNTHTQNGEIRLRFPFIFNHSSSSVVLFLTSDLNPCLNLRLSKFWDVHRCYSLGLKVKNSQLVLPSSSSVWTWREFSSESRSSNTVRPLTAYCLTCLTLFSTKTGEQLAWSA